MALLHGNSNLAIASFRTAAQLDPDYFYFSVFPQGIWTYAGRANYVAGRYAEARQVLERAVSLHQEDSMAKLYLGITSTRSGVRQRGLKEIGSGMRGLHEWLDFVNQYAVFSYGQYWDPTNEIRSEIKNSLAMTSGKEVDSEKLITGAK